MKIETRIARGIGRVHAAIDLRADEAQSQLASDHIDNLTWLDQRATFYRRSIGQINRFQRGKK